jgi:hypothetical protein
MDIVGHIVGQPDGIGADILERLALADAMAV